MLTVDTNAMRYRDGGLKQEIVHGQTNSWTGPPNGTPIFPLRPETHVKSSTREQMWDVVTKDFHKRQANGEIFNSPMIKTSSKFRTDVSTIGGIDTWLDADKKPYQVRISEGPYSVTEQFVDTRMQLTIPEDRLVNLALTSAYAGVSANDANAVLWVGEARETVKMVSDIGSSLWGLYQKTKKQRLAWAQGKMTIPEAQSFTLGLLYGILPLEEQISQVMEGLFAVKEDGSRHTSRGFQVHTDTKTLASEVHYDGPARMIDISTESVQATIRAGVMYDIDIDKLNKAQILLDPKQLVSTAYALARMSFVIDWFLNVGNTLKAWSPTVGTRVLASWVTVEVIHSISGTQSYTIDSTPDIKSTYTGDLSYSKEIRTKTRYPVNRSDLAIAPRLSINLDTDKLFALILLFAKVKNV